ncbi:MAG: hypothetical protein HRU19_25250 [Pseudobacteriovorax sp.]|nr:hypothetical protein [Pseudobacteriovorax sp.]
MIRKFLICGKQQLYLQNQIIEGFNEIGKVIELMMPIRDFWELEDRIKEVNYLLSSGEPSNEVVTSYKSAVKYSAPFAVKEDDRNWMVGYGKE